MGTPHQGSPASELASILVRIANLVKRGNKDLVRSLAQDAKPLQALQESFYRWLKGRVDEGRGMHITCFYEGKDVPLLGTVSVSIL